MADSRRLTRATADVPNGATPLTLVVDALGRIRDCCATTGQLFKASHDQMIGLPVSAFIVGVIFEGNSPGETARQLARLCAEHDWQAFTAIDAKDHIFPIEINVTREMSDAQALFVFNLRHQGANY